MSLSMLYEFKENIVISGLTLEQIAKDLQTSTSYVNKLIYLQTLCIEDPWILRNYLFYQIRVQSYSIYSPER